MAVPNRNSKEKEGMSRKKVEILSIIDIFSIEIKDI